MGATQRNAAHGSGGDPREAGRGEAGGGEDDPVCPASEPDGLGVRFPSPSALDIAPESTRNDQDAQKADNSPVPTHLWEFFFEHTYQAEFGELPGKWRQSLDGFRRLQLRWWRHRKLAATFRQWRLRHYPLPNLRRSDKLSWSLLRTVQCLHWSALNSFPKFETSRLLAADALSKAAGPYHCHHPRYIDSLWTWPLGATLFF